MHAIYRKCFKNPYFYAKRLTFFHFTSGEGFCLIDVHNTSSISAEKIFVIEYTIGYCYLNNNVSVTAILRKNLSGFVMVVMETMFSLLPCSKKSGDVHIVCHSFRVFLLDRSMYGHLEMKHSTMQ